MTFAMAAPVVLANNRFFYSKPRFGVAIWLSLFCLSMLFAAIAVFLAFWSVFETWLTLHSRPLNHVDWLSASAVAFAPWIILAVGGISLAIANQKLSGLFANEAKVDLSALAGLQTGTHQGYVVIELPVDVPHVSSSASHIIQTRGAAAKLTDSELEACWQHEAHHIRAKHSRFIAFVNLADKLLRHVPATRAMKNEVSTLLELAADKAITNPQAGIAAIRKLATGKEADLRIEKLLLRG